MAKKPSKSSSTNGPTLNGPTVDVAAAPAVKTSRVRQSSVPPKSTRGSAKSASTTGLSEPAQVTREMIAERAYHLWRSGAPGGEFDHWCAAERELRAR
jgi:Protein of unknown function (DUF2934)